METYACEKKTHETYGYPQPFIFFSTNLVGSTNVPIGPICLATFQTFVLVLGNFHEEIARPTRPNFSKWYPAAIFVGTLCWYNLGKNLLNGPVTGCFNTLRYRTVLKQPLNLINFGYLGTSRTNQPNPTPTCWPKSEDLEQPLPLRDVASTPRCFGFR